jgi:hypothetical protein
MVAGTETVEAYCTPQHQLFCERQNQEQKLTTSLFT